ncbi:dehydrin COR410-like [Malus sylvestris]|uniref:dehydrin COR410-like n=1 Tax=Malus sylvestris TaxID=3752 RepID=UPI0021ABBACC|nr:dehydrin COR410-like [Malus sylvestris]
MEDQYPKESQTHAKGAEEEAQGCGMFDFLKKKDNQKPHQEQEQHKHTTLAEKLHHHDGDSSSSSSDEEGGEKKKKGLKGKIKEKISSNKEGGDACHASVPAKNGHADETGFVEKTKDKLPGQHKEAEHVAEEKGFVEKIKEKLPGENKKAEHHAPAEYHAPDGHSHDSEAKKGILEKIKDKFPGSHKTEEEKHKEN